MVRSVSSFFCLVNENFFNCTSTVPAVFFILSRFLLSVYDVTLTSNVLFVHSFMQFQLNCVLDVIFHFLCRVFLIALKRSLLQLY